MRIDDGNQNVNFGDSHKNDTLNKNPMFGTQDSGFDHKRNTVSTIGKE